MPELAGFLHLNQTAKKPYFPIPKPSFVVLISGYKARSGRKLAFLGNDLIKDFGGYGDHMVALRFRRAVLGLELRAIKVAHPAVISAEKFLAESFDRIVFVGPLLDENYA